MKPLYRLIPVVTLFLLSSCSAVPQDREIEITPTASQSTAAAVENTAVVVQPTPEPTLEPTPEPDPHFPPEVIDTVRQLVDKHKVPGIAIGLLTPDGAYYFNYGTSTWDSEQAIDEHSLFEIGSITKVFTSILLANAVEQGLVTLDTPAQELAPEGVTMPAFIKQGFTLRDIASQRSGLTRMPSNFNPADSLNPYVDYTAEMMYDYLDGLRLGRKPGSQYEYSNLGFMLLGDLLERAYGKPYEELVSEIITGPLEMPDTVITLSEDQRERFTQAHSGSYPVKSWEFVLPGVGALRSTTTDMLKFLSANMHPNVDQLGSAMQLIRAECYETGNSFVEVCLGIHTWHRYSKFMYQHDGETGGYHSFSGFVPDDGTAVIVLANSNYDIGAIGLHLLDPKVPLLEVK